MAYCGQCGNEIPDGNCFCSKCGEPIDPRLAKTQKSSKSNDSYSGTSRASSTNKTSSTSYGFTSDDKPDDNSNRQSSTKTSHNNYTKWFIGIALITIFIICIVVYPLQNLNYSNYSALTELVSYYEDELNDSTNSSYEIYHIADTWQKEYQPNLIFGPRTMEKIYGHDAYEATMLVESFNSSIPKVKSDARAEEIERLRILYPSTIKGHLTLRTDALREFTDYDYEIAKKLKDSTYRNLDQLLSAKDLAANKNKSG